MPASDRKVEANRRNSQNSTGPRTEAGKQRTRANAVKHGLSGEGVVVPPSDTAAVAKRMEEWRPEYRVDSPTKEWAFEQLVVSSIRMNKCQDEQFSIDHYDKHRALLAWEVDQEASAALLGDRLARKPELVSKQLRQSKYGCQWLLEQWSDLKSVLDSGESWNDEQVKRAYDLIGLPLHDRESLAPLDDPAGFVENTCTYLRELIADRYEYIDNLERTNAEDGNPGKPNKKILQLRRYEAACVKRFLAAQEILGAPALETRELQAKPPKIIEKSPPPEKPVPAVDEAAVEAWDIEFDAQLDAEIAKPVPVAPTPVPLTAALPTPAAKVAGMNRRQRKAMARRAANGK
jgi:hypothetical protein